MQLYVIRHAIAEAAERDQEDADRPLTDEGRERFAKAVRAMRRLELTFERVLYSPWKRAHQTAKLLEPIVYGSLEKTDLLCQAPTEALLAALKEHANVGPVAVVGHQPWLSELIAWLTVGDRSKGQLIAPKKGSLISLEGEPTAGGMALTGYLTPRALRSMR